MSLVIDLPENAPEKLKPYIPAGAKWYALAEIDMVGTYPLFRGLLNRLGGQSNEIAGARLDLPGQAYLFAVGMN